MDAVQDYIDNFSFHKAPFHSFDVPFVGAVMYFTVIYILKTNIKTKRRVLLFSQLHNLFLCLLSLLMMIGTLYNVVVFVIRKGNYDVMCDRLYGPISMAIGGLNFWCYVFYVSKYYEMLDTVLMVLKGRPLTLIHCYHHFIVPFLFYSFMVTDSTAHWVLVVNNSFIHVVMYAYYLLRTLGYNPWWKELITVGQIIQFVIDMSSTWPHIFTVIFMTPNVAGWICRGSMLACMFGQIVGLSFIYLFSEFYFRTYKFTKTGYEKIEESNGKSKKA